MEEIIETNDLDSNYINLNITESEMLPNNAFEEEVIDYEYSEETELPIDMKSCLILNNAYIDSIDELKDYLVSKSRENDCRQNELKTNTDYDSVKDITINSCGYTHPNSLIPFMAPYFKDIKGLTAPSNEDVIDKKRNGELNESFLSSSKPWNMNEREKLEKIVRMNAMERLQKPLRDAKEMLTKVKNSFTDQKVSEISELTKKLDEIGDKELTEIEVPERGNKSLDWLKFATILDTDHEADDCELYWNNYLHPNINKNEWTKEEDKKLESLVKKYGMNDWEEVSRMLGTGRLGWQCCSRYQTEMNRDLKRVGPLTKAEAEIVEKVIESCRVGDYIPWHQVSYFIEGRSLPQIKHYWNKINVPKRGDVWIDEENKVLSAAVKKYGIHNWRKVAHFLPGRSNRQCRERYMMRMNVIDRKLGNWTPEEDKQIMTLAQKHNFHWVKVEKEFKGRNARQIASRYDLLIKHKSNPKQTKNKFANKSRFGTRNLYVRNRLNERIRQIINRSKAQTEDLDQILRIGRAKLAKRLELECSGIDLSNKGRPKKSKSEEIIDKKICEMFAVFDQKSSPKKAIARGSQDQCVYNTTKDIVNEILTGNKVNTHTDLSKAIRFIISNSITSNNMESIEGIESETTDENIDSVSPPIFPPNRTTVRAMRTMLMQTDYLSRKIAKSKIGLEEYSAAVPEDENYTKLCAQFKSLFCWPALLSLINTPERSPQPEQVNDKSVVKSKRRSWLTTDTSRMIEIRTNQTQLIQTAMQSKEDTKVNEPSVEEPLNESSTRVPWYLTNKDRRYNLKSLDKNSFVFTRVKPRYDVIPESDEDQLEKPSKRKCKSTDDSNNESKETGNTCDEPVIQKRRRIQNSKSNHQNPVESDSTATEVNDISGDIRVVTEKQNLKSGKTKIKSKPKVKDSVTKSGNRSSPRILAIKAKAI